MKLIITAQGPEPTDQVDPRFGRAQWFIVYDEETGGFAALDNEAQVSASQGAGVQAAQIVAASGAVVLLSGHCGPKAFDVLTAAKVQIYSGVTGTVEEALAAWRRGDLELLSSPDGSPQH